MSFPVSVPVSVLSLHSYCLAEEEGQSSRPADRVNLNRKCSWKILETDCCLTSLLVPFLSKQAIIRGIRSSFGLLTIWQGCRLFSYNSIFHHVLFLLSAKDGDLLKNDTRYLNVTVYRCLIITSLSFPLFVNKTTKKNGLSDVLPKLQSYGT